MDSQLWSLGGSRREDRKGKVIGDEHNIDEEGSVLGSCEEQVVI